MGHHDGLIILVPVLRRPHRVVPLLESIGNATPHARVLFLPSPDDLYELRTLRSVGAETMPTAGNYARKINTAVRRTTERLLFLGADDLHFHPGWFERACERLTDGIGVVGTNDLCSKRVMAGTHSTHSLVTRDYARRGTVDDRSRLLHEGYLHEFVDDEFVATAIHRGAFAHAHDAIVEHLHPQVGKAPVDALYAGQRRRMRQGRRIFEKRKQLWT